MFNKKTTSEEATPKTNLRRKALIWTGTAVGIFVAYAYLSKSNAKYSTTSEPVGSSQEDSHEHSSAE